jgi:hypothetical protein
MHSLGSALRPSLGEMAGRTRAARVSAPARTHWPRHQTHRRPRHRLGVRLPTKAPSFRRGVPEDVPQPRRLACHKMPLNSQFFPLLPDGWIGHPFGGPLTGKSFLPIFLGCRRHFGVLPRLPPRETLNWAKGS